MTDPPPPPPPPVNWQAPAPEPGPAPGFGFGGFGARLGAYILDAIILTFVVGGLIVIAATIAWAGTDFSIDTTTGDVIPESIDFSPGAWVAFALLTIVGTIIAILYFPWFWARGGQTPGMRPFGLYVVRDADGGRIGWGAAILRLLGFYVSSLVFYLGFIWIFIDKRRRGWHDLIAGTVVIKRS